MPPDFEPALRMKAAGIGFAGIDGAWWLPAREPFALPAQTAQDLRAIGRALFALFDAVDALYASPEGKAAGLVELLTHKVPERIPRLVSPGRVESLRPDFQLCPTPDGDYQLVATELELCPSAHGFAHAMQAGYGLEPDLAQAFARYLDGRELVFAGTHQWSEFLIEQLAFCRALAEHGARGRVLYDRPLDVIAREFLAGQRWQPPMFGVPARPAGWDADLLSRLRAHGLLEFAWPGRDWPEDVGEAVVFRFGYFDCFAPDTLARFQRWQARGATFLNPATFYLESKAVLAALGLPAVRARIAATTPDALPVLDRCLPETVVLREAAQKQITAEPARWVLKFAGFDSDQQAWGGRSLQIGAAHTRASWTQAVERYRALPWPAVAQRLAPTAQVDIAYVDALGQEQVMRGGYTRLRTFLLRGAAGPAAGGSEAHGVPPERPVSTSADLAATACGSHITVSGGTMQVSEATDAVQAPVIFQAQ